MSKCANAGRFQSSIPMKFLYVHKCIALFRNEKKDYDVDVRNPDNHPDPRVHRLVVKNNDDKVNKIEFVTMNLTALRQLICGHQFS